LSTLPIPGQEFVEPGGRVVGDAGKHIGELGSRFIDPEEDGVCEADGGHEGVGAAVIAHGGAAPVLEPAEHVFDAASLAVELPVMLDAPLASAA
jgi:hypothetical protein